MSSVLIEGGTPLIGSVNLSGSRNTAIKAIYASMYSNEDIILDNVPRIKSIEDELDIIRSVGGTAEWLENNTLLLNGSTLDSYKIPFSQASKNRTVFLFVGPLLYRFGKAYIPKIKDTSFKASPVNRFLDTWDSLGISYAQDSTYYMLSNEGMSSSTINFKSATQMGTEHAILTSLFLEGESLINNASEEVEIDSLITFLQGMGGVVTREEPKVIKVVGTNIFRGTHFQVPLDKNEAAIFATAALVTKGNILINGATREALTSFVHLLMKIGARFEFSDGDLKVWRAEEDFVSTNVTISHFPGLVSDWKPLITLLLNFANGESLIHDTVYTDRSDYIRDLNRMGAKVDMLRPTDVGLEPVVSDDSYDLKKLKDPYSVIKITGPSKLRAAKLDCSDIRFGVVLVLAALCSEGRSEILNYERILENHEGFFEKLKNLGAKIEYVSSI